MQRVNGPKQVHSACVYTAQCTIVQKRGIEIACRLSVYPFVCNVGGSASQKLEILETNCTEN